MKTFGLSDLFAGKMHAVLCREWKGRVKGRDWYDLVWFVSKNIPLNLFHLKQRMQQSGYWKKNQRFEHKDFLKQFDEKIQSLDIKAAQKDVAYFIKDSSCIEVWSKEFFMEIAQRIIIE